MRGLTIHLVRAGLLARFVALAAALRECTPYLAGEAFHTGFGPFVQAAYENRKLMTAAAKVRLAWRVRNLGAAACQFGCRIYRSERLCNALSA